MPEPEPSEPLTRMNAGQRLAPGGMFEDLSTYQRGDTFMGFFVTSGKAKGGHNKGSRHYSGNAVDLRIHGKSEAEIQKMMADARAKGYRVLDERKRPKGQAEWRGPHIHVEIPKGATAAAKPQAKAQPPKPDPARRKIENALAGQQKRLKGLHPLFDYKEHRAVNDDIARLQKKLAGIPEPKEFFDNLGKQSREARSRVKNFNPAADDAPGLARGAKIRQEIGGQTARKNKLVIQFKKNPTPALAAEIEKVDDRLGYLKEQQVGSASLAAPLPPFSPKSYDVWAKRADDLAWEARKTSRLVKNDPSPANVQRDQEVRAVLRNVLDAMGNLKSLSTDPRFGAEAKSKRELRAQDVENQRKRAGWAAPFESGVQSVAYGALGALKMLGLGEAEVGGVSISGLTREAGVLAEGNMPADPNLGEAVIGAAGSMAAFYVTTRLGGGVLQGIGLAGKALGWAQPLIYGATEAATNAGGTFASLTESGMDENEARGMAQKQFLLELLPNIAFAKWGMPWEAKGLTGILNNALPETIQEGWQMGSQNLATGRPWSEGIEESMLVGGLAALLFSAPAGLASMRRAGASAAQIKEVDDFLKQQVQNVVAIVPVPGTDVQGYDARPERPADPVTPMTEIEGTAPKVLAKALSNEKGEPIVVYHGGRKQFSSTSEMNFPNDQYTVGAFFTSDQATAGRFGKEITPATVHFTKPFVVDAKGAQYNDIRTPKEMKGWVHESMDTVETDNIAEYAIKHGYDGAIIKNVVEGFSGAVSGPAAIEGYGDTTDVYIAFGPEGVRTVAEMEQANQPIAAPESVVETPVAIAQGARSEAPSVQTTQDVQAQEGVAVRRGELPGERIMPPDNDYPFNRYRFGRELPKIYAKERSAIEKIGEYGVYSGRPKFAEDAVVQGLYEPELQSNGTIRYTLSERGRRIFHAMQEEQSSRPFDWYKSTAPQYRGSGWFTGEVNGHPIFTDKHILLRGAIKKGMVAEPFHSESASQKVWDAMGDNTQERYVPVGTFGTKTYDLIVLRGEKSGDLQQIQAKYYDMAKAESRNSPAFHYSNDRKGFAIYDGKQKIGVIMANTMEPPTSFEMVIERRLKEEDDDSISRIKTYSVTKEGKIGEEFKPGTALQTDFKKVDEPRTRKTIDAESSGIDRGQAGGIKPPDAADQDFDGPALSPAELEKRLKDVINIARAEGIPVFPREGRHRALAGVYEFGRPKFRQGLIRIYGEDEMRRISTVAHEVAHSLDGALWRARRPTSPLAPKGTRVHKNIQELFNVDAKEAAVIEAEMKELTYRLVAANYGMDYKTARTFVRKRAVYYHKHAELFARLMESTMIYPGQAARYAPTAVVKLQELAAESDAISDFLAVAGGAIIDFKPVKGLLPDRRTLYIKNYGRYLGEKSYDAEVVALRRLQQARDELTELIRKKFKGVKDDPALLVRAGEGILGNDGKEITFGTRDYERVMEGDPAPDPDAGWEEAGGGAGYKIYSRARYTEAEARASYEQLTPAGKALIDEFTRDAAVAKDIFSRSKFKAVFEVGGNIEGWVHRFFKDRVHQGGKRGLKERIAAARLKRTGKQGYTEDLQEALTKSYTEIAQSEIWNEFVNKQIARLARPLGKGEYTATEKDWVVVEGDPQTGFNVPNPGTPVQQRKRLWEVPNWVFEDYIEKRLIAEEASEGLKLLQAAGQYWSVNVLVHPGTVALNAVSGAVQTSAKIFQDFYLDVADAATGKPKGRTIANIISIFETLTPQGFKAVPDWSIGGAQNTMIGLITETESPFQKTARTLLYPFNLVERFHKKAIFRMEQRQSGQSLEDALNDDKFIAAANKVIDIVAYDYKNIPRPFAQFKRQAFAPMVKPFATYYYKHLSQIMHYTAGAFDPKLPVKERVTRLMALSTIAALITAWERWEEDDSTYGGHTTEEKGGARLSGRKYVGKTSGGELWLRTEQIPFVASYDFIKSVVTTDPELFQESTKAILGGFGPGADALLTIMGYSSEYNKYQSLPGRFGDTAGSFIPGTRLQRDAEMLNLDKRNKQGQTFMESFSKYLPGLQGPTADEPQSAEEKYLEWWRLIGVNIQERPKTKRKNATDSSGGEERTIEPRR